jgi:hypothetical protein
MFMDFALREQDNRAGSKNEENSDPKGLHKDPSSHPTSPFILGLWVGDS